MRRVRLFLALEVLALAAPALAQEGAPPRPTTVITQPKPPAQPPKPKPAPPIVATPPAAPLSRYASSVDQASQCRAQCAETHLVCAVDDSGPGGQCDSEWSRCNVRCSGTGYVFHNPAFKPSH